MLDCLLRAEEEKKRTGIQMIQVRDVNGNVYERPYDFEKNQFASKDSVAGGTSEDEIPPEVQKEMDKQVEAKRKLLANPSEEITKMGEKLASDPELVSNVLAEVGLENVPEEEVKSAIESTTKEMVDLIDAKEGEETEETLLEKTVNAAAKIMSDIAIANSKTGKLLAGLGADIIHGTGPHGYLARLIGGVAASIGITTAVLLTVGGGVSDLVILGVNLKRAFTAKGVLDKNKSLIGGIGAAVSGAFAISVEANKKKNNAAQRIIQSGVVNHFVSRAITRFVFDAILPPPGQRERGAWQNSYLKQAIDEVSGNKDHDKIIEQGTALSKKKDDYMEEAHKLFGGISPLWGTEHYYMRAIKRAQSMAELEAIVASMHKRVDRHQEALKKKETQSN